jgi:hypothetical protein
MADYKIPADGESWRAVMEKRCAQDASYYICGKLSLGSSTFETLQEIKEVRIPISAGLYEALEGELEVKGKDSRIFVSGGLELSVKVPCVN